MVIELSLVDKFVDIKPAARVEIKRQLELNSDPNASVRIIVVIDRYSGYVFDLEFDSPKEGDYKVVIDNIPIVTNKSFMDYVKGMAIDFDSQVPAFSLKNENPSYNCVPGSKYECPSCNLYEEDE